jgi:hypothetical protein
LDLWISKRFTTDATIVNFEVYESHKVADSDRKNSSKVLIVAQIQDLEKNKGSDAFGNRTGEIVVFQVQVPKRFQLAYPLRHDACETAVFVKIKSLYLLFDNKDTKRFEILQVLGKLPFKFAIS